MMRTILQALVIFLGKLSHRFGIQLQAPAPWFQPNDAPTERYVHVQHLNDWIEISHKELDALCWRTNNLSHLRLSAVLDTDAPVPLERVRNHYKIAGDGSQLYRIHPADLARLQAMDEVGR